MAGPEDQDGADRGRELSDTWSAWQKGLLAGIFILLLILAWMIIHTAISYDGTCGGLLPFMGTARPCSLLEYLQNDLSFALAVILAEFWWGIAAILLIPSLVGYWFDKQYRS
jgi:hypothetical protein